MRSGARLLALASGVLSAAILTGCGGAHSAGPAAGGAPATPLASAATRSVSAAARRTLSLTAKLEFRLDAARAFGSARAPVFGRGSFDLRSGRGEELLDLPEVGRQEFGNEHAIILPARVYLQPKGNASTVLPRGKVWMSAAIAGSEAVNTNFPQFVGAVEGINPVLALSELALGSSTARAMGKQLVNHVPAEHYLVTVDLTRALSGLSGVGAAALGAAIQQQLTSAPPLRTGGGAGSVPFEVWVNHAGRVVEYRAALPGTGDGSALVEMRSFGTAVRVSAPVASRVVDITSLTPSGERENAGGGDSDGG